MIYTKNLIWTDVPNNANIPTQVLKWLIDDDSLTSKLKKKYPDFKVIVLSQLKEIPHKNETSILNYNKPSIIRQVNLIGNNTAVVFARSIIPITYDTKNLLNIKSQPLGEILFNDPSVARDKLQVTKIAGIWGRRSIFLVGNTKLLVSEFFLKPLYEHV